MEENSSDKRLKFSTSEYMKDRILRCEERHDWPDYFLGFNFTTA